MSTARVLSGKPLRMEDAGNGFDRLLEDVVIDVGELLDFQHGPYRGFEVGARDADYDENATTVITAEAGFELDFSSIPLLAQSKLLLGPKRRYRFAGVGHDKAYRVGVPRGPADRAWWIIATSGEHSVSRVRGWLGWAGLRLGGWWAYRARRKERAEEMPE